MAFRPPEPITRDHDVAAFACGHPPLDRWLQRHALANEARGRSRTFVVTPAASPAVAGYYCLSACVVEHGAATARAAEGMPVGEAIPAVLLGRLAVDGKHQGQGLGRALLADAVARTYFEVAKNAGVRLLLVHAKDEVARAFYLRNGFEPSPSDPLHVMLLMQDVERSL